MDNAVKPSTLPSWWPRIRPHVKAALWLALSIAPLAIALTWGAYFNDDAYVAFRHARNLALGRGLTYGVQTPPRSVLYTLTLWSLAELGVPPPQAGLILSALGWSAAVWVIHSAGRALHRSAAATLSAALLAFNPMIVATLGTKVPWIIALAWIALAASINRRWNVQTCALALMLLTHLDLITLTLATLLVATQWLERRRFPPRSFLIVAVVASGCGLLVARQIIAPPSLPNLDLPEWEHDIRQLLNESEFYWLFPPLCLCGMAELLRTPRKTWLDALLWGATAFLVGGPIAGAVMTTLVLFLTGLGVHWIITQIKARTLAHLNRITLAASVMLTAGLPLAIAQVSSLVQHYQLRPVVRYTLEAQAGEWLRTHSEPTATVFGSERLGYLADRAVFLWDGHADVSDIVPLLKALSENPPQHLVSFRDITWKYLTQTRWFQDTYTPVEKFSSPYEVTSPLTIWSRRPEALNVEERHPLNVRLPGDVNLIGYTLQTQHIQPGDTVDVTLFLQPTRPVTESLRPIVQMSIPQGSGDWQNWWQVDSTGDYSIPTDWWLPGETIAAEFELVVNEDLPVGAYRLDVLVLSQDTERYLGMYQDGDTSPVDRVLLGYVAVPWQGEAPSAALDRAKPVDASFGDRIGLLGFEAEDSAAAGGELEVTLYWSARQPPEENLIVFVQLIDDTGQPAASHDGAPMNGRYPSRAWFPGDVVPDAHRLTLDPATASGTYRLQVGLYRWPSLERLPAWDSEGNEQADQSLLLQWIEVTDTPTR
jgi:hypothetical protein